jgi:arsenite methyltransferase
MTADSIFGGAAARKLEAAYLTPDVVEQRRATLQASALRPGERVLDVGSGPGLLAAEMAQVVGLAGHIIGIDVSDAMLALGQRRCANVSGTGWLSFVKADATVLPFPDGAFDAAVSIQVYEYVDDPERMGQLLDAWRARFADPHLPRTLGHQLRDAGFQVSHPRPWSSSTLNTTPILTASLTARSWPTMPSTEVASRVTRPTPGLRISAGWGGTGGTSSA